MPVKAYVMIVTDPGATARVLEALRGIDAIVELHEVMGPYDIVAEVEVPTLPDVPSVLSARIRATAGIQSTTTLVAFPASTGS